MFLVFGLNEVARVRVPRVPEPEGGNTFRRATIVYLQSPLSEVKCSGVPGFSAGDF
jgi:hypothetical protein